jgi:hypothetical protein
MSVRVETITCFEAGTGGLSLDDNGNLYSGDFGAILGDNDTMGRRVLRITSDGRVSQFASGFHGASGNRFGPDGALYQSNIRGNRISRIDSEGQVEDFATEGLAGPVGLAFDLTPRTSCTWSISTMATCSGLIRRVRLPAWPRFREETTVIWLSMTAA